MELGLTTACLGISLEDVGPPAASLRGVWQRPLSIEQYDSAERHKQSNQWCRNGDDFCCSALIVFYICQLQCILTGARATSRSKQVHGSLSLSDWPGCHRMISTSSKVKSRLGNVCDRGDTADNAGRERHSKVHRILSLGAAIQICAIVKLKCTFIELYSITKQRPLRPPYFQ